MVGGVGVLWIGNFEKIFIGGSGVFFKGRFRVDFCSWFIFSWGICAVFVLAEVEWTIGCGFFRGFLRMRSLFRGRIGVLLGGGIVWVEVWSEMGWWGFLERSLRREFLICRGRERIYRLGLNWIGLVEVKGDVGSYFVKLV